MIGLRQLRRIGALAALSAVTGCPHARIPRDQIEELPQWRTDPKGVRVALVTELLDAEDGNENTIGALDIIRQMRSEGERDPVLDLLQGKALRMDGITSEAERLLLIARKRMGRDAGPSQELCILYADMQRIDEAIEECRRATSLDASNGPSWNNLGFLMLASEHPSEALEAFQAAVEIDANQARYRNNLGMALAAVGREDQAFRTLATTMSRADAAFMVGIVLERYDSPEAARLWFEKALKLDPNHAQAKDSLAQGPRGDPAPLTPGPLTPSPLTPASTPPAPAPAPAAQPDPTPPDPAPPDPAGEGSAPPQEEP